MTCDIQSSRYKTWFWSCIEKSKMKTNQGKNPFKKLTDRSSEILKKAILKECCFKLRISYRWDMRWLEKCFNYTYSRFHRLKNKNVKSLYIFKSRKHAKLLQNVDFPQKLCCNLKKNHRNYLEMMFPFDTSWHREPEREWHL